MSGVIYSRTQTFLASSIILPHKPKSKNQPLFLSSTKLNCLNAAVRHKHTAQFSQSKPT